VGNSQSGKCWAGQGSRAEVELNLLFISEHAIYGQQRKDFHTNFWAPNPKPTHFAGDGEPCANFKFMHGKFAHAVKINDVAARKCLAQLVEASKIVVSQFVWPVILGPLGLSITATVAADPNQTKRQLAAVRFWLWL